MASWFFCSLLFIVFHLPVILATGGDLSSSNATSSQTSPPQPRDCIMVAKRANVHCDGLACIKDGGRCLLNTKRNRCMPHLVVPGLRDPDPAMFASRGPESCRHCACIKALPPLTRPPPRPRVRESVEVVGTTEQGPGFQECTMKSSATCGATDCFAAGGRCKLSENSGRCYPHVLDSAGRAKLSRWGLPSAPRECKGCRCRRYLGSFQSASPPLDISSAPSSMSEEG